MESELPLIEKQEERLTDEAFAFIGAGTETTKQSLSSAMFYLLSNSNHMIQLKKELWKAMPSALEIPEVHVLESLPYLVRCSCSISIHSL